MNSNMQPNACLLTFDSEGCRNKAVVLLVEDPEFTNCVYINTNEFRQPDLLTESQQPTNGFTRRHMYLLP